jgi:hypothetical protein
VLEAAVKRWLAVSVFAVCLCAVPCFVHAYFKSGNDLKQELEGDGANYGYGMGFIVGVSDSYNQYLYCLPAGESGVTVGQVVEVVKKYLRATPERLHEPAYVLVVTALQRVWPCAQQPAQTKSTKRPKPKPAEAQSPF